MCVPSASLIRSVLCDVSVPSIQEGSCGPTGSSPGGVAMPIALGVLLLVVGTSRGALRCPQVSQVPPRMPAKERHPPASRRAEQGRAIQRFYPYRGVPET